MTGCASGKGAYPSRAAAVTAAARVRCDDRGPALHPYLCACGAWHLTRGTNLAGRIRASLTEKD